MKKIRLIAFICVLCIAATMLSSCNLIDECKEKRFVFTDEKQSAIEYKGKKYVHLDKKSEFSVNMHFDGQGWAVEKDVPLLLIDAFGILCYLDSTKGLISVGGALYCLEEKYDEYNELMNTVSLDHYKIDYYAFDYTSGVDYPIYIILDDKTIELIDGTLANVVGKEVIENDYFWSMDMIWIDRCDSKGFLQETDVFRLYRNTQEGVYGITTYTEITGRYITYEFPREHEHIIEKIFEEYFFGDGFDYEMTQEYIHSEISEF